MSGEGEGRSAASLGMRLWLATATATSTASGHGNCPMRQGQAADRAVGGRGSHRQAWLDSCSGAFHSSRMPIWPRSACLAAIALVIAVWSCVAYVCCVVRVVLTWVSSEFRKMCSVSGSAMVKAISTANARHGMNTSVRLAPRMP